MQNLKNKAKNSKKYLKKKLKIKESAVNQRKKIKN